MKTKLAISVILVGSLVGAMTVHAEDRDTDRTHPMTYVKDSVVTTKVKSKLAAAHIKSLLHVKVDTDNKGIVVLSGNVRSQEEADKAVAIAQGTEGVTSVTNKLQIKKDD